MDSLVPNAIKAKHLPNITTYKAKLRNNLKELNAKFSIVSEDLLSLRNSKTEAFIPVQKENEDYIVLSLLFAFVTNKNG